MIEETTGGEEPQSYDDITVESLPTESSTTDELGPIESLLQSEDTDPQQSNEPVNENSNEQSQTESEQDEWDNPEDYEIDLDGESYSFKDVLEWKKDADNKADWSKSNTQKAQNLASLGRLFEQIQGDPKLKEYIKDYYHDNPNGLKDSGLDEVSWDNVPEDLNPEDYLVQDDPQNVLMQRVEQLEVDKNVSILEQQLETLESKYPQLLGAEKTDEFLKFVDEAKIGDLDVGFRLWATDALLQNTTQDRKLDENRSRNEGKVISTQVKGASNVVNDVRQNNDWRKVSLDDPEISKYFNK